MKFLEKLNLKLRFFSKSSWKADTKYWKKEKKYSGWFFYWITLCVLFKSLISSVKSDCVWFDNQSKELYEENSSWIFNCMNCTCREAVSICNPIQCKYQQCELGKLLLLGDNECCPKCSKPMHPCNYDGHLIQVRFFR
jgi:hypothetical protein